MKKRVTCIVAGVLLCVILVSYINNNSLINKVSKTLNVDLKNSVISKEVDTHGGFGNDGYTFIEISISEKYVSSLEKEISESKGWNKFPLTEDMEKLIYGEFYENDGLNTEKTVLTEEGKNYFSYVTDDDYKILFPKVEKGYYYFCNRRGGKKTYGLDNSFFQDSSHNFSIALYDLENGKLYYYELDT